MRAVCAGNTYSSMILSPLENNTLFFPSTKIYRKPTSEFSVIPSNGLRSLSVTSKSLLIAGLNPTTKGQGCNKMEDYNTAMKRMMRNPYEYHHDLGINYTLITDNLIVGSQPQKPEDINHLKEQENVAYILNLQQDKDLEYWGIDLQSIILKCQHLGVRHMRRPAKDFDPDSLRNRLPKAVSSLEWAIEDGKGRVYVHCTAGLGRAPAVAITFMFWFSNMDLTTAYSTLTEKRPCGPNKTAIRGATYDLAKTDEWKQPFENLPEHAFEDIADWERTLIQQRVRSLRGTYIPFKLCLVCWIRT